LCLPTASFHCRLLAKQRVSVGEVLAADARYDLSLPVILVFRFVRDAVILKIRTIGTDSLSGELTASPLAHSVRRGASLEVGWIA